MFLLKNSKSFQKSTSRTENVRLFHGTLLHGRVYSTTTSPLAYPPMVQCVSGGVRYKTTADKYGGYSLGMPLLPKSSNGQHSTSVMQCHVVVTDEAQRDDRTVLQGIFHIEAQWKQDFYVRGEDVAPPPLALASKDSSYTLSTIKNAFLEIYWFRKELWKWKMVWLGILLTSFGVGMLWMEDRLYTASLKASREKLRMKLSKVKIPKRAIGKIERKKTPNKPE